MTTDAKKPATTPARSTRRFNVAEYYRMGEVGIFHPEERLELIEGVIMLRCPPAPLPEPRKFTVAEYYLMAEAGILAPDERVELIDGEIVVMAPIGDLHAMEVRQATRVFYSAGADSVIVSVQNPVNLGAHFNPQPDIALLRFRDDNYPSHPTPSDILLVIEVSDTSLGYDRNTKIPAYAHAQVPEAWLLNLPDDCLERFTQPGPDGYQHRSVHRRGERIAPAARPDLDISVADLLPPATM